MMGEFLWTNVCADDLKLFAGILISDESSGIYRRIEAKHALITTLLFRGLRLAGIIFYMIPTIVCPVWYACFRYPAPEKWFRPVSMQYDRTNHTKANIR